MVITCEKCLAKLEALGVPVVPARNDYGHRCHGNYETRWKGGYVVARGVQVQLSKGILYSRTANARRRRWARTDRIQIGPHEWYRIDGDPAHCFVRNMSNEQTSDVVLCNTTFPIRLLTLADGLDPIELTTRHINEDREKIEAWLEEKAAEQKAAEQKAAQDATNEARAKGLVEQLEQLGIEARATSLMFPPGAPTEIAISLDDIAWIVELLAAARNVGGRS